VASASKITAARYGAVVRLKDGEWLIADT